MERESRTFDVVLVVHDENDTATSSICRLQGPWYFILDSLTVAKNVHYFQICVIGQIAEYRLKI